MKVCARAQVAGHNPAGDVRKFVHVGKSPSSSMPQLPGPCCTEPSFTGREEPSMSPPDAIGSTAFAAEQSPASLVEAGSAMPVSPSRCGKAHAVPVREIVG